VAVIQGGMNKDTRLTTAAVWMLLIVGSFVLYFSADVLGEVINSAFAHTRDKFYALFGVG
jgi:hypothetical protein